MAADLVTLNGSATESDAIDTINRAITHIKRLDQSSTALEDALEDLRKGQRQLQEAHAQRQSDGPEGELLERYSLPAEIGSADARELLLYGRMDDRTKSWIPGFLDDMRTDRPAVQRELQRAVEDRAILHTVLAAQHKKLPQRSITPIADMRVNRLIALLPGGFQRAFVDTANKGAEWIPTDVMPMLLEEIGYGRQLAGLFSEIELDRDTKLPYLSGGLIPYIRGAGTDDDPPNILPSSLPSDEREFNLKNLSARTLVDRDASEDSIIPTLPLLRMALAAALVAGEEDCLYNGDTGTHQDTGLASWNPDSYYGATPGGGSLDHRRAWIGIRARGGDVSNSASLSSWATTPDLATLVAARVTLKGPKQGPRDSVMIASGSAVAGLLKISDFQTLEKYGMGAVVFTGEVGRVAGMPVVESQFATNDLNTSGVYDNATKTKGSLSITLRSRWIRAVHRSHGVRLETETAISTNYTTLVASRRLTYKNIGSATEKNTYYGYNI